MESLDNKTTQVEFDKTHALILASISTNKERIVKVNRYGAIPDNDEAGNYLYIFRFTYVPYTLQEYVE